MYNMYISPTLGRAIAQAASRWLPTAAARVRALVWSCGICGGQSGAGAGFLRVLRFLLPIFIPPIAPQSPSSIIWGLYNTPEVAAVPSGLSPTPTNNKKNNIPYFNVTSGGIRCSKGTPIIKKSNPSLFIKGGTPKEEKKTKVFNTEHIYGHGSQRGSMPGVTVLAGYRQ
jgi:hypothetical protein